MGKKLKKAGVFIKEHKQALLIGGGVILTTAGVIFLKKKTAKCEDILSPKVLGEGYYEHLINDGIVNVQRWTNGKHISHDIWIDDGLALVRDFKTIGDDLCECIPGITPDNRFSAVLFISDEKGIK